MPRGGFSRDPTLSDHDIDDIAFLTGSGHDSGFLMNKRALYESGSVLVCSQKRACIVVSLCFCAIILSAVIVAFTKPGCPAATYIGEPLPGHDNFVARSKNSVPLAHNGEPFPWGYIRLPRHIRPLMYSLHLHPNLTTRAMIGQVKIKLTAREETDYIILHGRDINITKYSLHDKYLQPFPIIKFLRYPKNQLLYLGLSDTLRRGSNYTLYIDFQIELLEGLDGFYLSSYKDGEDQTRYLAATHFEPTSARAAFPCFDEPHLKARFKLTIVRELHHFSLFNMPLKKSIPVNGTHMKDEFETSVAMSTYLVCFVVCDFAKISNVTNNNVTVNIYAPSNIIHQASYALTASITLLEYYQEFFTVPYPLPKLDLIAIPNFDAGAMENWGLVTYRETSLMFIRGVSSSRAEQRVTVIIAHELAHQWFGNLVTMEWWQDLWLNEGFASFMECLGTGTAKPDWSMMDQFVVSTVQPGLALDSLRSSHPVSTPVDNPANIESIFDTISYKKGASLIYMLEMFLGRQTVVAGLRSYLDTHRYASATTKHLWEAFGDASELSKGDLDVELIMDTWTRQVGYPLVSVVIEDGHVIARQTRFLSNMGNVTIVPYETTEPPPKPVIIGMKLDTFLIEKRDRYDEIVDSNVPLDSSIGFKWHIPLTYVTSEQPHESRLVWMNRTDVEFEVGHDLSWVKFNVGQRGFYRVNYDSDTWSALVKQLKTDHKKLSPADRASLIDDAFALANANVIDAEVPLDLSLYLKEEDDFGPWETALTQLFRWSTLLFSSPLHNQLLDYICDLLGEKYTKIGWEDQGSHLEKLLRSKILQAAIDCGNDDAIETARQLFEDWTQTNETMSPNVRREVYRAGVRHGSDEAWDLCFDHYKNSTLAGERKLLLEALAQTSNVWLLEQFLSHTLEGRIIRSQDIPLVLSEVSRNPNGRLTAWRYVRKEWPRLYKLFGHSSFAMGQIIKDVTEDLNTLFDFYEVSHFFSSVEVGGGERSLRGAMEQIMLNIHWLERSKESLEEWFKSHNYD